jgi:small-conductance mechanosensitive channel
MTDIETSSLQQSLAKLRAELANSPRLDDQSRAKLHAALVDIESRLQQKGAAPAADAAPHPLESLAVGFVADHPTLAASVRQFIDLLGQAGL